MRSGPDKRFPIQFERGITSPLIKFHSKRDDGTPVVMTNWHAFAQVRTEPDSEEVVLDLQPEISNAEAGEITLKVFTDEETAVMPVGEYYWDLVVENELGERIARIARGRFTIRNIITREVTP